MWSIVLILLSVTSGANCVYMDTTPIKVHVDSGKNVALSCTVHDIGSHMVYWYGPSDNILFAGNRTFTKDTRITLTRPYKSDWNIHIRNVKPSDEGVYECRLNTVPRKVKRNTIKVNVPPRIIDSASSPDLSVKEGHNVTITCVATGVPTPKFRWHVKHKDSPKKEQLIGSEGSYTVYNITRDQAAIYICTAFNTIGSTVSREIKVSVEFAPEITIDRRVVLQLQGQSAKLVCGIQMHPVERKNLYWMKGQYSIHSNHTGWKYKSELLTRDENTLELWLDINYLESSDYGLYTCVALNDHGMAREDIILQEYKITTKAPPTTTSTTTESTTSELTTTISSTSLPVTSTLSSQITSHLTSLTTSRVVPSTTERKTTKTPIGPVVPPDPISPVYNISSNPEVQTDPGNSASAMKMSMQMLAIYSIITLSLIQTRNKIS